MFKQVGPPLFWIFGLIMGKYMKKSLVLLSSLLVLSQFVYAETDQELMASGQWRDPQTGLIWMRCSIGQTWTSSTCMGIPKQFTGYESLRFAQALQNGSGFAGYKNWRLPTPLELASIRICSTGWEREISHSIANVDGTVSQVQGNAVIGYASNNQAVPKKCAANSKKPTLNTSIFPNTWSNSPKSYNWWTNEAYGNYDIYSVSFYNGLIWRQSGSFMGDGYMRLVRQ